MSRLCAAILPSMPSRSLPEMRGQVRLIRLICGPATRCQSAHILAKVGVEGSNPFARSKFP
jgi:hypothetical protein